MGVKAMIENIKVEEFIDPDKKKERYNRYEEAHAIAKKFLQGNPSADSKSVYESADLAVKVYSENESIRKTTSLSKYVQFKIQSALKQDKGKIKKPKPRISEEVKKQIIEAKVKDESLSNKKLAKIYSVADSSVGRILARARSLNNPNTDNDMPVVDNSPDNEKPVNRIMDILNTVVNTGAEKFYFQGDIDGYSFSFSVGKEIKHE